MSEQIGLQASVRHVSKTIGRQGLVTGTGNRTEKSTNSNATVLTNERSSRRRSLARCIDVKRIYLPFIISQRYNYLLNFLTVIS